MRQHCFRRGELVAIRSYDDPATFRSDHLNIPRQVWDSYNGIGIVSIVLGDKVAIGNINNDNIYSYNWYFYNEFIEPMPDEESMQYDLESIRGRAR